MIRKVICTIVIFIGLLVGFIGFILAGNWLLDFLVTFVVGQIIIGLIFQRWIWES